ncbi:MAG: hypothetical protein AMK75_01030, partial [Planctomycetes bacterium SM23_65]
MAMRRWTMTWMLLAALAAGSAAAPQDESQPAATAEKHLDHVLQLVSRNELDKALEGFQGLDTHVPMWPGKLTLRDLLVARLRVLLGQRRLLDDIVRLVSERDVETSLKSFTTLESRVLGYPGNAKAAELIVKRLEALGFERLSEDAVNPVVDPYVDPAKPTRKIISVKEKKLLADEFEATVPMDRGATLEVPGVLAEPLRIYPLWPNLVRTSQLPRGGVSGHLVYVGRGTYAECDGKKIEAAIALMDFNCEKY